MDRLNFQLPLQFIPEFNSEVIEGLRERTEHLAIFLFSTHHSVVFYF